MAGHGFWDGFDSGDDYFKKIINLVDFPMESLEGDDLAKDWDANKIQCVSPILLEGLKGLPPVTQTKIGNGTSVKPYNYSVPGDGTSQLKQFPKFVEETSSKSTSLQKDSFEGKDLSVLQAPSPISVLERSSPCSVEEKVPTSFDIAIPVHTRTKPPRPSTFNPWLGMSPISSTSSISRKVSKPTNRKKKKKRMVQLLGETLIASCSSLLQEKKCKHCGVTKTPQWRDGPVGPKTLCNACGVRHRSGRLFPEYRPAASTTSVQSSTSSISTKDSKPTNGKEKKEGLPQVSCKTMKSRCSSLLQQRKCMHCGVSKTPQWRDGPMGPRTLCNACGVRHRSGRLFPEYRPAASPTFVPSLHSNIHKKVSEMRNKATIQKTDMAKTDPPMLPSPEFE